MAGARLDCVVIGYNETPFPVYEKLLRESALKDVHVAPNALRVASMFAVLSRLEESKKAGVSPLKKMKLYDGEEVDGFTAQCVLIGVTVGLIVVGMWLFSRLQIRE